MMLERFSQLSKLCSYVQDTIEEQDMYLKNKNIPIMFGSLQTNWLIGSLTIKLTKIIFRLIFPGYQDHLSEKLKVVNSFCKCWQVILQVP